MHLTGMGLLATCCLEPQTIRPPALLLPTQSPTRRPQNTARSSQPEVSRTVSADSVLGPGRYLTSMERPAVVVRTVQADTFKSSPAWPLIHAEASHL